MLRDPKESEKVIRAFSRRVMRRLFAAGDRSLTQQDIEQELWVAWVKACEAYDPEIGVPFLAYLSNGMRQHINRYVEKNVDRRHDEVGALSLDMEIEADGGRVSMSDAIPSDDPIPGDHIEENSHFAYMVSRMSPRAQLFVTLLRNQPIELLEEVRKLGRKSEFARELGITVPHSNRLTTSVVFAVMGAEKAERTQIMSELRELSEISINMAR